MMKKILALLTAALMVCMLFAGCAKNEDSDDTASEGNVEDTTEPAENTEPSDSGTDAPSGEDQLVSTITTRSHYSEDGVAYDDPRLDEVVVTCGNIKLTNRQLQFYYQMSYMNFMNTYGMYAEYFGLDTTQPMSEQASLMEGLSWEQYFLCDGLENFHMNAAVANRAQEEGYVMPEESEAYILSLPEDLDAQAESYGYENATAYLQDAFGPAVDVDDYVEFARLYYYVTSYENQIYRGLSFSDEEIEAYYDENEETFTGKGVTKDMNDQTIDVRHILITPKDADGDGTSTDEEWAAAEAEANRLLDEYLIDPTETNFAEMANEFSEDPGSNTNGGLYEMVLEGQMVETFNNWCFDSNRLVGDTGIVKTTYGYHIMYFVQRNATPYWMDYTLENGLREDTMNALVSEITDSYPLTVHADQVLIASIVAEG